ncbi:MAG TPA: alpha-glucosidase C-terminal domain-containing protein, partial [Acidimicrobiales bacterium]
MKRVIALRKRYRAFGRGSLQMLLPDNRKVLAFLRIFENERILVVVNLSRYAQAVELDLADYRNTVPVELFGGSEFPAVGDLPYFITLGPHGFYWFSLESHDEISRVPRPALEVTDRWEEVLAGASLRRLEEVLPAYIADRRWFREKARRIKGVRVTEVVPLPESGRPGPAPARLALTQVELDIGHPETYLLPFAYATGNRAEELVRFHPEAVIAVMRAGGEDGVLYDAAWDPDFARALLDLIRRRRQLPGRSGRLAGLPTPSLRRLHAELPADLEPQPIAAEQSNSSIAFGDHLAMKLVRRVEEGPNPGVELGRFLTERTRFAHAPAVGGSLEYRPDRLGAVPMTLVTVEEYAVHECDGWTYVVDALRHGLEEAVARYEPDEVRRRMHRGILSAAEHTTESDHPLLGPHETWAPLLGQRTAELHLALATDRSDPDFAPEPLTSMDRQAMYHGARSLLKRTIRHIRPLAPAVPAVQA